MPEQGAAVVDSSQILQDLLGNTNQAIDRVRDRTGSANALERQIAGVEDQIKEAVKIRDKGVRDARLRVLETTLEALEQDAATEEKDLAAAVFGLNTIIEQMGAEYTNLGKFNTNEQAPIDKATADQTAGEAELEVAKQKTFFKGRAIAAAEENIRVAKGAIKTATEDAQRKMRARLQGADMEASLQEFTLRVERTVQIMEARREEINTQVQVVGAARVRTFEEKGRAAQALEKLQGGLTEVEAELQTEEEKLRGLENGTPDHARQTEAIAALRAKVEQVRGEHNTALIYFQSKERFAEDMLIHERTQMKLRDNMRMWITMLRSDTEARVITFRSRLEAQKGMADQDIARRLDEVGVEVDLRNAEYMASAGALSDRLRMDRVEKHPDIIRQLAGIAAAQAEAVAQIRHREREAIAAFKAQYGIDPTNSSFFRFEGEETGASGGEDSRPDRPRSF